MNALAKCPTEVETGFYFSDGYISVEMPREFRDATLELGLSFKVQEPSGVLLLAQTQSGNISLSVTANQVRGRGWCIVFRVSQVTFPAVGRKNHA